MKTLADVGEQLRELDKQFVHDRDNVFAKMATVVEGCIEHSASVRDHAWLARFTKADYDNRWNEVSPLAAQDISSYVRDLLDRIDKATEGDE